MAVKDLRAARRYATALFASAQKQGKLDAIERDMTGMLELMQQTPALRQMWESPQVPTGRKRELLRTLFENTFDPLTLSFLRLLVDKRREDILEAVDFELRQQADASRHVVRAEATFAVPPTHEEQESLIKSLEHRTGERVLMTVEVNPGILGGVIVRMQDTIIDGSVRGSLERMREQLLQEA
jgi:F-type H+-transporting ATPase subunit delta